MGNKINEEKVWAGTEMSLKAAIEAEEAIATRMLAGEYPNNEEEEKPRLLTIEDGVATVSIKGSLNNDSGFWNEIFGMTGYPEIRDAVISAASDDSVSSIVLDIDSGGGAVSGVADTAALIRTINDQVKPVVAFTDGVMTSAAYWLGASAGEVHASKTAVVGSIGVLSTHKEYSEALKKAGIGVSVIRAGKYKALANSVEPLSAEGRQQIQQVVDAAYSVFVDHVSRMRGKSYEYTDEHMAQGREFIGAAAKDVGLVDSITTFDKLMGAIKEKSIDASNNFMDNRGKSRANLVGEGGVDLHEESDMKTKKPLTAQDIAAIAAGAVVTDPAVADPVAAGAATEPAAADPVADPAAADPAAAEPAAAGAATEPVAAADNGALQMLMAQLKEKDEALLEARVEIKGLKDDLTKLQATSMPLAEIAVQSINNMRVAMNSAPLSAGSLDTVQILAEHKSLTEQFAAKFKVGGIAAVSAGQTPKDEPVVADALTQARYAAVPRFSR